MRPLRIRRLARVEILDAFEWYLARSPQAATGFIETVDAARRSLKRAADDRQVVVAHVECDDTTRIIQRSSCQPSGTDEL